MTTNKNTIQKAVVDKPPTTEPTLNKHEEAAMKAAKTDTQNNGSHITNQRKKLIDDAKAQSSTKKTETK
jgi:hypothetical protein